MVLKTVIKPTKIVGTHIEAVRNQVIRQIMNRSKSSIVSRTYSSNLDGYEYGPTAYSMVMAYSIEKKKAVRVRNKKTQKYDVVQKPIVTAYYYTIPYSWLVNNRKKLIQHPRYFEIIDL